MLKMIRALVLCACSATLAIPQTRYFSVTATGTGATASVWADSNFHTLQVVGSPSVCTIRLEGSLDNNNWQYISGSQTCTSGTSSQMFHVDGKPVSYVRANVLTFTGTSITIIYTGRN